ncbi:MAG: M20/M25/M40 family metallo-hydrolase [Deltaproteobacteria bacterium]|nr:M20/M25/M40 family metallo-hydrolase [Deltaproteobacteria bacterium]MBW2534161.1 M20/M25/M40 family metallo-hydrolase [Deltaproteobacteria bacterium]
MKPATIDEQRLRRSLRRLVDIYSPSGKEEEIVSFVARQLRKAGLPVERVEVDEDRDDLLVRSEEVEPRVVFVGHLDTVPAYDFDRLECRDQDERILGLGAADMKGGCAAMIEAFTALGAERLARIPAALALVVGEEEAGDGAEALLRHADFSWAIVGEPSRLAPCLGSYSYLEAVLKARGRRAHASLGNPKDNAIQRLLRVLLELTEHLDQRSEELVYNLRDMESSEGGFAIPDRCEAWLDLHLRPGASTGQVTSELGELVAEASKRLGDGRVELDYTTIHEGYELPDRGLVPEVLRSVYQQLSLGWEPTAYRSHSDANLFWAAGVRPIILGPGALEVAHSKDEAVAFDEVAQAARIYLAALESLERSGVEDCQR